MFIFINFYRMLKSNITDFLRNKSLYYISVVIIIIIIRHKLGLDKLVSASSNSLFKGFQVTFISLVYCSALFFASCCHTLMLHVIVNLICIFLVSQQLVLLSTLPKFLPSQNIFSYHNSQSSLKPTNLIQNILIW